MIERASLVRCGALLFALGLGAGCKRSTPSAEGGPSGEQSSGGERSRVATQSLAPARIGVPQAVAPGTQPLQLLHLPEAEENSPPPVADGFLPNAPPVFARCPSEMVDVAGAFCIDRYESSLVDRRTETQLSPHYAPRRQQIRTQFERYRSDSRLGLRVPEPSRLELDEAAAPLEPMSRSVQGLLPHGYLDFETAQASCERAGKRLCSLGEWVRACRGAANRKFPYGERYEEGACNVFREGHPAALLHGDASSGHLDPRLGLVPGSRGPLLRPTGATASCRSVWGQDAVFDMVGNLDERVADGSFVGGFFSRATREGCDARIASHAREYFDYSIGLRCCKSP